MLATFRQAVAAHGIPASTLTDNGMVFTTRLAGGRGGRNALETELRRLHVRQKNSRPNHPTTCGKVERFQQTLKKWLRGQPVQPRDTWPSCKPCSTPSSTATTTTGHTARYRAGPPPARSTPRCPKHSPPPAATPTPTTGSATTASTPPAWSPCAMNGRLHHIGIGRTHARTHVILLVQDLHVRIVNAITGELLRELLLDPTRDYQPTGAPKGPTRKRRKAGPN